MFDFTEKPYQLFNGDCLAVMRDFPSNSIDCVITSPPYNLDIQYNSYNDNLSPSEYKKWCYQWLKDLARVVKSDGRLIINIPLENTAGRIFLSGVINELALSAGWNFFTSIIWNKQNCHGRTAWGSWKSASSPSLISPCEAILVFYKDQWKKQQKGISTISDKDFIEYSLSLWSFSPETDNPLHPAPFPIELPLRCLRFFTFENEVVMDLFMGSGTTGMACMREKRKFVGIEFDEEYFWLANSRIKRANLEPCDIPIKQVDKPMPLFEETL